MAYQSPPAETRQCSQCGRVLSLNFFALDGDICRSCERKHLDDAESAAHRDL